MPASTDSFQRRCMATTTPDSGHQSTNGDLVVLLHVHDTHHNLELQVCSLQSQALTYRFMQIHNFHCVLFWLHQNDLVE